MAKMNFGGVIEEVMTREEFPLEKARDILKDETIAVLGYGTSLSVNVKARPTRRPSLTVGYLARHYSLLKKLQRRLLL